jgi:hypothetical protein
MRFGVTFRRPRRGMRVPWGSEPGTPESRGAGAKGEHTTPSTTRWTARFGGATITLTLLAASTAHAVVVANNGTDGPTCGLLPAPPCRSLGRAIANAHPGDTVVVGPGPYGDLDGSGTLGDSAGERHDRARRRRAGGERAASGASCDLVTRRRLPFPNGGDRGGTG